MNEQNNRLFIGNLPYSVNDEQLADLFKQIEGLEVTEAKVVLDKYHDNRSKGFGFVTLANEQMAATAIEWAKTNNMEVEGRKISVDYARPPRENRDNGYRQAA